MSVRECGCACVRVDVGVLRTRLRSRAHVIDRSFDAEVTWSPPSSVCVSESVSWRPLHCTGMWRRTAAMLQRAGSRAERCRWLGAGVVRRAVEAANPPSVHHAMSAIAQALCVRVDASTCGPRVVVMGCWCGGRRAGETHAGRRVHRPRVWTQRDVSPRLAVFTLPLTQQSRRRRRRRRHRRRRGLLVTAAALCVVGVTATAGSQRQRRCLCALCSSAQCPLRARL